VKNQSGNIKLSNVKKKKKSLPTYPPADSVGWQCQTNNILRVALGVCKDGWYCVFNTTQCSISVRNKTFKMSDIQQF
jgi:hypothetical protein